MKPYALILALALPLSGCSHSSTPVAPIQTAEYTIARVGTLPPFPSSKSAAINNSNEMVGRCYMIGGAAHGIKWVRGRITDFGPHDSVIGNNGINDTGEIVGQMYQAQMKRAFIWDGAHLDPLSGGTSSVESYAASVNNAGDIAGCSRFTPAPQFTRAVLWRHNAPVTLPTRGRLISSASGINDRDEVVGWTMTSPARPRLAAVWIGGVLKDLEHPAGCKDCGANGINRQGEIAGYIVFPGNRRHACVWRNGHTIDLGTLGGKSSEAEGINAAGEVVGWSQIANGDRHAFLYRHQKMVDLNSLVAEGSGWLLRTAAAINDMGAIAGSGMQITAASPDSSDADANSSPIAEEFSAFVLLPSAKTRVARL